MLRSDTKSLIDIPNVGKAIENKLMLLGINKPSDLVGRDPYQMFNELYKITGQRHDPCLLDVFISAVRYMEGAPAKKWWEYTQERKKALANQLKTK